jgi:hypothetical protein
MGMAFVPMSVVVLTRLPDQAVGIGSAVLGTMQQIGGAVGLAILVTISTAAQAGRSSSAAHERIQAQATGSQDSPPWALDAVVHGYSAAYTASLILLVAAWLLTVFGISASISDSTPRADAVARR